MKNANYNSDSACVIEVALFEDHELKEAHTFILNPDDYFINDLWAAMYKIDTEHWDQYPKFPEVFGKISPMLRVEVVIYQHRYTYSRWKVYARSMP